MKTGRKYINMPTVYAAFYPDGKLIPKYVRYKGITFKITKVLHSWKQRLGEKTIFYFSLTDDINNIILSYTTPDNIWKIEEIHSGVE